MLVAIAHNAVPADARDDERDVLLQVDVVQAALEELGHRVERMPVSLDLRQFHEALRRCRPDAVFQLVESIAGSDRYASLAAAVIESAGIPLTGSWADALWVSNDKTLTKRRLVMAGLPTPAWCELSGVPSGTGPLHFPDRYILKPAGEHASLGMDESAFIAVPDLETLLACIRRRSVELGKICFAERFVAGREFNVSLLASPDGCEVLPLAEIDFSAFPVDKPRIVDYRAKWQPGSFEFDHTPRRFLIPGEEPQQQEQLRSLARHCWDEFQLRGYVRVDFRMDSDGQLWILELNTNPCLSPDAGFCAALQAANIRFSQAVARILQDSRRQSDCPLVAVDPPSVPESSGGQPNRPRRDKSTPKLEWRYHCEPDDPRKVRELVAATGYFYPDEVAVAEELVRERLEKGEASGYHFVFAERAGELWGYSCYGPIACTRHSFDLYWIAVDPRFQGSGVGRLVLVESERRIALAGGRQVYIETSNRSQYASTRAFYERCQYRCEATLAEFYGPGDDKVIYVKSLGPVVT